MEKCRKMCYTLRYGLNLEKEERKIMRILVDTHSHTIASGHAYSTLSEMARAAGSRGLQALAITEHAPEMENSCGRFYFMNYDVVPREMNGVRLLMGAELNILDAQGTVDLPENVCRDLDIAVASIHPPCYRSEPTKENNTRAYVEAMKKPYINIIGHPDDSRVPVDYEILVKTAKETGTLLELNNSSLRPQSSRVGARENMLVMLDLCRQYEVPITTGSDAHIDVDAGNFTRAEELLEYCGFPEELVVTTDFEKIRPFINFGKIPGNR